jgi:1-acyl-sn-glycerol-3-phosphate acyltransferase
VRGLADRVKRLRDALEGPFDPYALDRRDPEAIAEWLPIVDAYARRYAKLEVTGREHLADRRALYVGNHNGGIFGPDLLCTLATLWSAHGPDAPLYALAHDFAMQRLTPVGRLLMKFGALRAHPDNAQRALEIGRVLVYPGGDLDAYRPYWQRNRVVFGPRTGFVRVAQRAKVPIVPIVAEGAHRSAVIFHEGEWLAGALGLRRFSRIERFPIALALPWGIAAGPWTPYLPLPLRVRLRVLPPIDPSGDVDLVRAEVIERMQSALTEMAARP